MPDEKKPLHPETNFLPPLNMNLPSFKKKIPEANDIWAVVNYMRTLK